MTDRTTQPPERARAITVTLADAGAAEKFRRGWGGKYDRDVNALADAFARHRSEGVREAVEQCILQIKERRDVYATASDWPAGFAVVHECDQCIAAIRLAILSPEEGDSHG